MKTMYCANLHLAKIEPVEVEYEIQGVSVKVDGRLQSRVQDWHVYCYTWQEAQAALVQYWTGEVRYTKERLDFNRRRLEAVQAMAQP